MSKRHKPGCSSGKLIWAVSFAACSVDIDDGLERWRIPDWQPLKFRKPSCLST